MLNSSINIPIRESTMIVNSDLNVLYEHKVGLRITKDSDGNYESHGNLTVRGVVFYREYVITYDMRLSSDKLKSYLKSKKAMIDEYIKEGVKRTACDIIEIKEAQKKSENKKKQIN